MNSSEIQTKPNQNENKLQRTFKMTDTNNGHERLATKPPKPKCPTPAPHHLLPPKEEESILRRSLKEIGEDMKKMEDLITLTEDIIRRERERDREFYLRERRRKLSENPSIPRHLFQVQKIEPLETRHAQHMPTIDVPKIKTPPSDHRPVNEKQSPLTLRKKITKRFKRKSMKSADKMKNANNQEESVTSAKNAEIKSPTLKINTFGKSSRKLIRFSPRRYRSRLTFRNGKIGCIDAENVNSNQSNVEKTHAIVSYITSDLDYTNVAVNAKRSSLTSNISDILSEQSSESLDDLPNSNSYFNFDYSATESDDRGIADEDFYMNSLTDIDSFTVQPKSDDEIATFPDQNATDVIEIDIQHQSLDEEMGNNEATPNMPTSVSDPALVDYIDETTSKSHADGEEKAPTSAMSNHSNIT